MMDGWIDGWMNGWMDMVYATSFCTIYGEDMFRKLSTAQRYKRKHTHTQCDLMS